MIAVVVRCSDGWIVVVLLCVVVAVVVRCSNGWIVVVNVVLIVIYIIGLIG